MLAVAVLLERVEVAGARRGEGARLGGFGLLEQRSPWLIVEFNTTLLASKVLEAWPVYRFLSGKGYRPFFYDRHGAEPRVDGRLTVDGYRNILFKRIS